MGHSRSTRNQAGLESAVARARIEILAEESDHPDAQHKRAKALEILWELGAMAAPAAHPAPDQPTGAESRE